MSKPIVNINFYGHDKPEFSGLPADFAPLGSLSKGAWQMYRRGSPFFLEGLNVVGRDRLQAKYGRGERGVGDVSLKIPVGEKDVCIYDYNAARTRDSNSRLALDLLDSRISVDLKSSGGLNQDTIFLITGSSAGCISALYLGRLLCER